MIQTISSKILLAVLSPFALLAIFGLLHYLAQMDASYAIPITAADCWMIGYIVIGLLLWSGLIIVNDMPGVWRVVTQTVWGLEIIFNIGAIWFWKERAEGTWRLTGSFNESAGIDWLALGVVLPVLAGATVLFIIGFLRREPHH